MKSRREQAQQLQLDALLLIDEAIAKLRHAHRLCKSGTVDLLQDSLEDVYNELNSITDE